MSRFDYPRLPRHEIVGVLTDFQIANVSEGDLLHPNADFVINLYSTILLHIAVLPEDQEQFHDHVDFEALERLENPEHHVESVRIMNLFDKIRQVVAAVDCPRRFTLKDLLKPDSDRTETFLSAILNFCLHRETKLNLFRPVVDELTILEEQKQLLEGRMSQLNGEIEEHNELREREMPVVQEVDSKVKDLRQSIQNLNSHQMSLKVSLKRMKEKVKEMDEKISSAEFALVQSVQENGSLQSKIVQSPDKLQRTLEEKKSLKVEAKNAERAAMKSFHDKTAVLEIYTKACKKLSKHSAQMKGIQEQVNNSKSTEKELKVLKVKLGDEGVLDKSLEAKLIEQQAKADQLDELKRQLQRERDLHCEEATKELNNVKFEMDAKRNSLMARQKQVEAVVTEADNTTAKINSLKETGAANMHELGCKCEAIVREFYQYSNSIRDCCQE